MFFTSGLQQMEGEQPPKRCAVGAAELRDPRHSPGGGDVPEASGGEKSCSPSRFFGTRSAK